MYFKKKKNFKKMSGSKIGKKKAQNSKIWDQITQFFFDFSAFFENFTIYLLLK